MTDIITTIIKEFQNRATIAPEIACAIEKDIRQRWGGGTAYIGKTCFVGRATLALSEVEGASSLPDNHTEMSGAKSRARPTTSCLRGE